MPFSLFQKQYQIRTGLLEVKIMLDVTEYGIPLKFDVLKDIELNYGYEDEDDLIVFYPNTCKLTFDDFYKQNYLTIKKSLSCWANTFPSQQFWYGGVEIWLNGVLKTKGKIDPLTVAYDGKNKTISFDVIDLTASMADMVVDRNMFIASDNAGNDYVIPENYSACYTMPLYGIYKSIWPDFRMEFHDISEIGNPGVYGIFHAHDWKFRGVKDFPHEEIVADWSNINDFIITRFNFDSIGMYSDNRPCNTWKDFIKLLALQMGAIIGVEDYGKVFFYKRFGLNNAPAIDLSNQYTDIKRRIHHDSIKGVVVRNHWNGERVYEYGEVDRKSNGEIIYKNRVIEFDTYVGSYRDGGNAGTCIYINPGYAVFGNVWDPQFGGEGNAAHAYQLVARWYAQNRRTPKELVELELMGIDYSMAKIYSILPFGFSENHRVKFRPMTMTKNLMKNKTKMSGLEI